MVNKETSRNLTRLKFHYFWRHKVYKKGLKSLKVFIMEKVSFYTIEMPNYIPTILIKYALKIFTYAYN